MFTTAGESTYMAVYDSKNNLVKDISEDNITGVKMSYLCRQPRNLMGPFNEKYNEEPSIMAINSFAA